MKNVCELFVEQVKTQPKAIAGIFNDEQISYQELHEKSNQLAHFLIKKGVVPETVVGLCLAKDCRLLIGILGILKAGGVYLPLEPTYPRERLDFMVEDAKPSIVVTSSNLKDLFGDYQKSIVLIDQDFSEPLQSPHVEIDSEYLSYVIYTSGSAGKPKGIMVSHANFSQGILAHQNFYPKNLISLLIGAISFDVSLLTIFSTLTSGGTICFLRQEDSLDAGKIIEIIESLSVNFILCVPSFYMMLLEKSQWMLSLKCVSLAGETIPNPLPLLHSQFAPHAFLYNEYGPSEYAIGSTLAIICDPSDQKIHPIHIGRPLPCTQVYVLDENLQVVSRGLKGEICISGMGLARGYLNRQNLTAEKFVWVSLEGREPIRLYRSGDFGRVLPDGNLEFLGRMDHQIKFRGYRIELGEIEQTICRLPGVSEAAVIVHKERKQLIAYFSSDSNQAISVNEYLKGVLPRYMIPSRTIQIEKFPRTPNGKIDREALLEMVQEKKTRISPQSELEQELLHIWIDVLDDKNIGAQDNFFDLGGDSLQVTIVQTCIENQLKLKVSIVDLYQYPTIELLAQYLNAKKTKDFHEILSRAIKSKESFMRLKKKS